MFPFRAKIELGVRVDVRNKTELWVTCLSPLPLHIESSYLDRESGRDPGIHKIYQQSSGKSLTFIMLNNKVAEMFTNHCATIIRSLFMKVTFQSKSLIYDKTFTKSFIQMRIEE